VSIDLHTHSTASDGTDTPAQLMAKASAQGLSVIALTDHDTTAGWEPAEQALPAGLTLIRGTEFSCVHQGADGERISLHLLGYLFDPDHIALKAERARLRESRLGRGEQIVRNLIADGYPVTWERVQQVANGASVGRPHIAQVLVENHVVASVDEAFAELLASNGKYYAAKADTDVMDAIAMVKAAGGVTVFAHPFARRRGRVVDDDTIKAMAAAGLHGLEVDHLDHTEQDRAALRSLATELGLLQTGSSDYHGTNKTTPLGACTTAPEQLEALLAIPTALRPVTNAAR